jgi:hypothetical protein
MKFGSGSRSNSPSMTLSDPREPLHFVIGFGVSRRSGGRQFTPMHDQQDSDFLPWVLTAAAVLIMAIAVRVGATEPHPPQPPQQATEHAPERAPASV